jgi:hypothetical protein
MSFADRAKYLGLRGPSRSSSSDSAAQALSHTAEFLRRTARLNIASAEAAADSFFAAAEEVQASSQSSVAQWDIPDWTVVLPGIKQQGGESIETAKLGSADGPKHTLMHAVMRKWGTLPRRDTAGDALGNAGRWS